MCRRQVKENSSLSEQGKHVCVCVYILVGECERILIVEMFCLSTSYVRM